MAANDYSDNGSRILFLYSVAFMKHINATLTDLGVKQEHIHYEFFGPAASLQ